MGKHTSVDDYVAAQPEPVRARLDTIRRAVAEEVPGVSEWIRYDMPVFGTGDRYIVHVAAWKQHIGLYPVPLFEGDLERDVAPLRASKDTVRMRHRDPFPEALFRRIVRELAALAG